ncbi:MAG: fused MFS/spermidine synthase, partial [Dongiaceae bacterium]
MTLYYVIIFITGAGTLALEVLASRVLTPYFGVSLYIWSSILSITLTFLAVGYYGGGWMARRLESSRLPASFFGAPAVSALAIVAACLIYPWMFPWLAGIDLVLGSILAATVLLAVPLVVLSAMNPLLVAIRPQVGADAGAGGVFFVSTLGSVAGVVVTAFLLIPHMTNFRALLLLAIILGALPLAGAPSAGVQRQRVGLIAAAAVSLVLAAGLFALAPTYLGKDRDVLAGDYRFTLRAEYSSVFGNLKVVEFADREDSSRSLELFLTDGLVQNRLLPDGRSYSEYTYMLEALSSAYAPEARTALVLGLGAGVVPRALAAGGVTVDAVEINPDMVAA